MPKFRYSLNNGVSWTVIDAALPYTIPSTSSDDVTVEPIGPAVANTFGQPNLNPLALSSNSATVGTVLTINILNARTGSTISGVVPSGLTLNSAARTITGSPTLAGDYTFSLTETLADSANSPRSTPVSINVAEPSIPIPNMVSTGLLYTFSTDYTGVA
jgi:hypothetical protein